jgi:hypothetical protein
MRGVDIFTVRDGKVAAKLACVKGGHHIDHAGTSN